MERALRGLFRCTRCIFVERLELAIAFSALSVACEGRRRQIIGFFCMRVCVLFLSRVLFLVLGKGRVIRVVVFSCVFYVRVRSAACAVAKEKMRTISPFCVHVYGPTCFPACILEVEASMYSFRLTLSTTVVS